MKILRNVIVCRQVKINLRSFPTVSPNIVEDIFLVTRWKYFYINLKISLESRKKSSGKTLVNLGF